MQLKVSLTFFTIPTPTDALKCRLDAFSSTLFFLVLDFSFSARRNQEPAAALVDSPDRLVEETVKRF